METTNTNVENEKKSTPKEFYARYCLIAKQQLDEESLAKKKKRLSKWLLVVWINIVSFTVFICFLINGFTWQAFYELTGYGLGNWIITEAVFLGLIFVLITKTRKPDFVVLPKIYKKADQLIEEEKRRLEATKNKLEEINKM